MVITWTMMQDRVSFREEKKADVSSITGSYKLNEAPHIRSILTEELVHVGRRQFLEQSLTKFSLV